MNANRTKLQIMIENRLTDYGYPSQNTPAKYQVYAGVRRTISLRLGLADGRENLSDLQLIEAERILDQVLPKKSTREETNTDMNIDALSKELSKYAEIGSPGRHGTEVVVPKKLLSEAAGLLSDYDQILQSMNFEDLRNSQYDRLEKIWNRDYFRYLAILDHCREIITLHDAKKLKQITDESMITYELMDLYILLSMYLRGQHILENMRLQKFLEKAESSPLPMSSCNTAQKDSNGCLGYSCGEDDEPIDQCKKCPMYTSYEPED